MPFVRIDLPAGKTPEHRRRIGDIVYDALLTINVPTDDRFQVITEHAPGDLILDPAYLGIVRSAECLFIQITLNAGRTLDQKRGLYKAIADGLHELLGMRREDVCINLVEVDKTNWSYGNGEAQYAP
ncbi:MAG: tautomerase family protein [Rhizobacter sp.]|nr:tautomerase family protein [Rhizobacter sp.]